MIRAFDCTRLDSPFPLLPPDGEVHLWLVFINDRLDRVEALKALLSSEEIDRAGRFYFKRDELRFIVAHGLLRKIIGRYLNIPAPLIKFRAGPFGKPELDGDHRPGRFSFNISHSRNLTVFAFSTYPRLGVDVEYLRAVPDFEEIVNGCFHPKERAALRGVPPHKRRNAFFDCWTRKEAFVKATGEGLHRPLDSFAVPLGRGNGFFIPDQGAATDERWVFIPLQIAGRYRGAVVIGC